MLPGQHHEAEEGAQQGARLGKPRLHPAVQVCVPQLNGMEVQLSSVS